MVNLYKWFCWNSLLVTVLIAGCQPLLPKNSALSSPESNQFSLRKPIPTVDVAIANTENSVNSQEYVGTTEPNSTNILRSQVEGRLLNLNVAVGDWVNKNQVIGRLDDSLLAATVEQERAELASLESELAKEELEIRNTQISLQEAKIQLKQAENDAQRYSSLAQIGAISQQQAESFQTAAKVAQQAVLLAKEEVKIAQQAVTTAMGRVAAQQSAISEAVQRQAYSQIVAPTTGIVVSKNQEPGNLVREGEEILSVGDLSTIKILLSISAVDLNLVTLGQTVEVQFDAIHNQSFFGKVSKISPVANTTTRKIPVEITVNNRNNEIKSGLLAKVQLSKNNLEQVTIPSSAITEEAGLNYIFVISKEDSKQRQATVTKRPIKINNSLQNKVFLTSGLESGEKYILRSSQPLTDNQVVNLSILSE